MPYQPSFITIDNKLRTLRLIFKSDVSYNDFLSYYANHIKPFVTYNSIQRLDVICDKPAKSALMSFTIDFFGNINQFEVNKAS